MLREIRESKGYSLELGAEHLAIAPKSLQRYECGERKIKIGTIKSLCDFYGIDYDSFIQKAKKRFSENNNLTSQNAKGVTINVLGRVAAGIPINAIQEIIDTEEITEEMAKTGTYFGLKIKGDSMTPTICDGDIVIVRQQDDAETGDVVIATINGDEATCKRLRKYNAGIELISNNPSYPTFEFSNEEILNKPVKIIGKVVELRRKF